MAALLGGEAAVERVPGECHQTALPARTGMQAEAP